MSALIFLLVLFVLVLVHEFGHYFIAKRTGMRVDEFGIGFPPKLFGIKGKETEYTFNALPLGGFVKIYGENGEEDVKDTERRAFSNKSKLAQAAVLIAGVTANVLFAWFLFTVAYVHGVEGVVREESAAPGAHLTVFVVQQGSPAEKAGLKPGDRIVGVENVGAGTQSQIMTPSEVSTLISASKDQELKINFTRAGKAEEVLVVPVEMGEGEDMRVRIGIQMNLVALETYPLPTAVKMGFSDTLSGLKGIVGGLWGLLRDSFKGEADLSSVAGPVGIAGLAGDASRFGFSALMVFTAFISLNLAVINLLPLPALDGGRLIMVAIEAIMKRPIPHGIAWRVNAFGFLSLLALMAFVTYHDILKLIA